MALSTTQYGYIIDPMVPFTDDKGNTIKDGFVRVFVAGSSTPVVTYRNFDGATNQDLIELDNSGRTKTSVIGSKGLTYKVCVYDAFHSQESPILTVDKVSVIGSNITAGAGATVVTGLDGLTTKPDGFMDASVVGTDGFVALDHTLVTDDLDTDAKVTAVEEDRYIPLLNEDVNDPDSKMTLGRLWQWVLGKIKSLSTIITAFRTGDVIAVDGPDGPAKMSKDSLLQNTTNEAKKINDFDRLYSITNSVRLNDSELGYVSVSGSISTADYTFRHFVCNVEIGKTYIVRTRLGTSTTWIGGGDSADQTTGLTTYLNDPSHYSDFVDYEITPTKEFLFISFKTTAETYPYTQDDGMVFVSLVNSDIDELTKVVEEHYTSIKRIYNGEGYADIGESDLGYINTNGRISTADNTFRHFVCKVEVGVPYVVRTRLGTNTCSIAGGDSADQTTGLSVYKSNNTNPDELLTYEITPTKEYLFISFHKLENVAPYTSDDWRAFVVKKSVYINELSDRVVFLEANVEKLNTNKQRLDTIGICLDIGGSSRGYITSGGSINTNISDTFRYFVCKVEVGKKYIVHTRLGTSTTWIGGGDSADQTTGLTTYRNDPSHYSDFVDYEITPTKEFLFITYNTTAATSPYTQGDGSAFVMLFDEEFEELEEIIDSQVNAIKRIDYAEKYLEIGDSKLGFISLGGSISTANNQFRHFVCKVKVGEKVYVHTRLGTSSCTIAGGDSASQISGLTVYKSNSINPSELLTYEITPTKEYLFISFQKVMDVAPYTSDDWEAYATTAAPAMDTTGIVPSDFISDGFTPVESANVLSGTGIFVAWGHTQTSRPVSRIKFYANQSGFIRFGVGIIDQRNWAIVDQYADIPCSEGINDINVLGYGLVIPTNGYLFTYNDADGNGTCVVWKTNVSGSTKGLVFTEDPSSAFTNVINSSGVEVSGTPGTDLSYAVPCLLYEMLNENLFYETSVNGEADRDWLIRTINETAQAKALSNVLNVGGIKYKIEKDDDGVRLVPFKYNKIVIFGNSIFRHGALSNSWLYDQIIGGQTYTYADESDGGMSGMSGRGMAASVQAADFKHRILAQAQKFNADVVVQGANIYGVERPPSGVFPIGNSFGYATLLTSDVDCIIYAAGENVSMVNDSYRDALESWVKYWQSSCPSALIVLCGRYWKQNKCDQITYDVAHKLGLPFVWKRMDEDTQAIRDQIIKYPVTNGTDTIEVYGRLGSGATHPGDIGMYRIAKDICNVIGLECDELEHSVVIEQSSEHLVYAPKTWIAGGLCTLLFSGDTAPNVSVSKTDGTSITTVTKTKAEMGFEENHNFGVVFVMPNEDVRVSISAN